MWCTLECTYCNDKNCEHYSPNFTENQHKMVVKSLEMKWLGKKTPDNTKIVSVHVDYRKDYQHMNRVEDIYGNMYFIEELKQEKN